MARDAQTSIPGSGPTPKELAEIQLNQIVASVMELEVKLRQARADERRARKHLASFQS